jgi:Arc/MetJ-type ribon-helix-helix transcriptional regulator
MSSQIIVELDEAMARELDAVAPARARKRSEFVRQALRTALDRVAEERMREAYQKLPDDREPAYFDPRAWEPSEKRPSSPRRKRRR